MAQVEVLMSTYNGERYLPEQIDSILNQSFTDWHLTVRDDGSTDGTVEILKRYVALHPAKISILTSEDGNLRCKGSFEALLKNAKADYYMFCDQDDVWLSDKIEASLKAMKQAEIDGTPCVVCSDLTLVDKDLKPLGNTLWSSAKINVTLLQTPQWLSVNNYVAGCTMLFNNEAREISLPFGTYAVMHDAWITLKTLANGGKIVILPESHILYRQHGGNVVGAAEIKVNVDYIFEKISSIRTVLKNNYANYKQAREIMGMSLLRFINIRTCYLLKR